MSSARSDQNVQLVSGHRSDPCIRGSYSKSRPLVISRWNEALRPNFISGKWKLNTNPYANAVKVKHNILYGALVYQFYGYHFPYICWAMFGGLWPNKLYLDLGFIFLLSCCNKKCTC